MTNFLIKHLNFFVRKAYSGSCIFIFGMPRGGTTWLAEYLSSNLNSIYVHEPLGLYNAKVKKSGYRRFEYFSSDEQRNGIFSYIKELSKGFFNSNVIKSHQLWRLPFKKSLVLKFIKGSSLVNDIAQEFSQEKFLLLIRNPISVISSQLRYGDLSQFYAQEFFDNPDKKSVTLSGIEIKINSEIEILAYTYGLNFFNLKGNNLNQNVIVVPYESLIEKPEEEIKKISRFLGRSLNYDKDLFKKESASTYSGMSSKTNRVRLTNDQTQSIWNILNQMGVNLYLSTGKYNSAYFEK